SRTSPSGSGSFARARKPFGPASTTKPSSRTVYTWPPQRSAASTSVTARGGVAARSLWATVSPVIPPPMTTTRDTLTSEGAWWSEDGRRAPASAEVVAPKRGGSRKSLQWPCPRAHLQFPEHKADGAAEDGRVRQRRCGRGAVQ